MPYFHDIDPIAFSIPTFAVQWYYVLIIALLVAAYFLYSARRQPALQAEALRDYLITAATIEVIVLAVMGWLLSRGGSKDVSADVHWYGIMYLLGFLGAWLLGNYRRAQGRLPVGYDAFSDLAFYVMLGVILGGRIWYMLSYVSIDWIWRDPVAIVRVWDGGMSFHGGLIGVLLASWLWSRRHRIHFMDTMDFVAPLVPIGLGLGRLGNFINGELWGKLTSGPWGVIFPASLDQLGKSREQLRAMYQAGELNGMARHPSQLYEFALEGVVMFTVLVLFSMKPRPRYAVAGLFAVLYGCFRFLVEFVRVPDAQLGYLAFGWVTMGQIQSLPLIVVGLVLLWMSRNAPTLQPDPAAAAAAPEPLEEAA